MKEWCSMNDAFRLSIHQAERCHIPAWSWWLDVSICLWWGAPYAPICIRVGKGAAAAAAEAAEAEPRPTAAAAACISAAEPQTSSAERAYSGLTPWWLKWIYMLAFLGQSSLSAKKVFYLKWCPVDPGWCPVKPTSNNEVMGGPPAAPTSESPGWPPASPGWWPPFVPALTELPPAPPPDMGLPSLTNTGTATLLGELWEVC